VVSFVGRVVGDDFAGAQVGVVGRTRPRRHWHRNLRDGALGSFGADAGGDDLPLEEGKGVGNRCVV